jgi:hypothetical protein
MNAIKNFFVGLYNKVVAAVVRLRDAIVLKPADAVVITVTRMPGLLTLASTLAAAVAAFVLVNPLNPLAWVPICMSVLMAMVLGSLIEYLIIRDAASLDRLTATTTLAVTGMLVIWRGGRLATVYIASISAYLIVRIVSFLVRKYKGRVRALFGQIVQLAIAKAIADRINSAYDSVKGKIAKITKGVTVAAEAQTWYGSARRVAAKTWDVSRRVTGRISGTVESGARAVVNTVRDVLPVVGARTKRVAKDVIHNVDVATSSPRTFRAPVGRIVLAVAIILAIGTIAVAAVNAARRPVIVAVGPAYVDAPEYNEPTSTVTYASETEDYRNSMLTETEVPFTRPVEDLSDDLSDLIARRQRAEFERKPRQQPRRDNPRRPSTT